MPGSPIFQLETFVNSGHRFAKKSQYELPHLLEHLAFEGSARFPDPQILRYQLEKFGIFSNAFTSFYMNGYVLYGASEYWRYITDLGFEWLLEPSFTQIAIDEQKQVVENELIRHKSNAESWAGLQIYHSMKNGQVPEYDQRIGSLANISQVDIRDYHEAYYQPENLIHIITGDLPLKRVEAITEQIETKLAALKSGTTQPNPVVLPEQPKQLLFHTPYPYEDAVRFIMSFSHAGFSPKHIIPLRVFDTILNGGLYSRIFTKSRERGLSYTVSSGAWSQKESTGAEYWDKTQPQHIKPLIDLILGEVQTVARGEFSDEELERAIGYLVGQQATRFQTALDYTGWYESVYTDDMPLRTPDEFVTELKAVTREQIMAAADYVFSSKANHRYLSISSHSKLDPEIERMVADFRIR